MHLQEALNKLIEFKRVKTTEFTNLDRQNLLDIFVNNEKVLIKFYEIMFEDDKLESMKN